MKKLTHRFWMWIAGITILGMIAVAGFSQGVFFQGNLRFAPGLSDSSSKPGDLTQKELTQKELTQNSGGLTQRDLTQKDLTVLTIMPTSNQLRLGSNSMFKLTLRNGKEAILKRVKMNLALYNLSINNVRLIMNDTTDVTDQLTDATQNMLNSTLRASDKKNLTTTVVLGFKENFKVPAGLTTFELVFSTDHVSTDSTLLAGVLDAVMNLGTMEAVVEGPLEKIQLFTTYTNN